MSLTLIRCCHIGRRHVKSAIPSVRCLNVTVIDRTICFNWVPVCRTYSTNKANESNQKRTGQELDVKRESPYAGLTLGQKVKEAGKDASYFGISIAALGVLGALVYYVGRELLSTQSPNGLYHQGLKRCVNDSEVQVALGQPIKGYGEETRRRRRRHVSHVEFFQDGRKHMRLKFYIEGTDRKADVLQEMVQDDSGRYQYLYLVVTLHEYPYRNIILEDNRNA